MAMTQGKFQAKDKSTEKLKDFNGEGTYSYGMFKYQGMFKDGVFDGPGTVYMKSGAKFKGEWAKGKMVSGGYIFADGLEHKKVEDETWSYCSRSDPRFFEEIKMGLPNNMECICFDTYRGKEIKAMPTGCYDVGDGYFDPTKISVCSFETGDPIRMPDKNEKDWILHNARQEGWTPDDD